MTPSAPVPRRRGADAHRRRLAVAQDESTPLAPAAACRSSCGRQTFRGRPAPLAPAAAGRSSCGRQAFRGRPGSSPLAPALGGVVPRRRAGCLWSRVGGSLCTTPPNGNKRRSALRAGSKRERPSARTQRSHGEVSPRRCCLSMCGAFSLAGLHVAAKRFAGGQDHLR